MKRLAYILTSLLLLAGCVKLENQSSNLIKDDGKVSVSFGVQLPEATTGTKAFANTPTINNLYIAVFDKGGMLTEYVKAESNPYPNINGEGNFKYTATLSVSDYPCTLHFIANGPDPKNLRYGSEAEVLASDAFITTYGVDRYWQRIQVPSIKKNEEGELDSATKDLLDKVALIRNFAKITVSSNAEDFELVGFYTMNTMDKGTTAAYNRNTGKFVESYQSYTATELIEASYNANVPISATLNTDLNNIIAVDGTSGLGVTYIFEREKPVSDPTFIIIAGKYSGPKHDDNVTDATYYKIDLRDENGDYFPFLRNFNYQINIYEVNRDGSATPEDAASAPGSSDISTSIEAKDLTNISDGTSRLFVDYTEMILVGSAEKVLRFKYIPDITWDDGTGNAKVLNDNVTVSLVEPGSSGHAIASFTIADTDEEDGYREITIQPSAMSDAIKTSYLKIVGSCPDGKVEHDGKTVVINPLQRKVHYTLRDSLALQVYCNPDDIKAEIGTDISVFVKIEDGLPSSIFSLDFYLEAEQLSLTSIPNSGSGATDALPVRLRESIIPGNDDPTFQFLKTITWAEYSAAPVVDGYKTFECKFKSSVAKSASAVYVYNPYFHLGKTAFTNFNEQEFTNLKFSKTSGVHEADLETFSFTMSEIQDVTVTLFNLQPAAGETKLTKVKTNADGSVDYELIGTEYNESFNLEVNNYEGEAKVILNAKHYTQKQSSVTINKAKLSDPAWTGKPMSAGSALTFTFKMDAAPQTNATSGATVGRAVVVLTNAKPASTETHLTPTGEANTYYYTPYGTDNDSVAAATQTIKLTNTEVGKVTVKVSADNFDQPNPLMSSVAPLEPLDAPTVTISGKTSKTITATWSDAGTYATGYNVYLDDLSSAPVYVGASETRQHKFTGLNPEETHTVYVVAIGDNENRSNSDPGSNEATTDSAVVLSTPSVTATNVQSNSLTFDWTCSDASHVASYDVYFKAGSAPDITKDSPVTNTTSTTYIASSVTEGTTYYIAVVAKPKTAAATDDDEYVKSAAGTANAKPKNATQKLDKPTVKFKEVLKNTLTFTWNSVSNATGYEVSTNGTSWTSVGNTTTYTLSNLSNNTSYTLYVRATSSNSDYETSDSGSASGKTAAWWWEDTASSVLQLKMADDTNFAAALNNAPNNTTVRVSYTTSVACNIRVRSLWYNLVDTISISSGTSTFDFVITTDNKSTFTGQEGIVFETDNWNAGFTVTLVQIIYP